MNTTSANPFETHQDSPISDAGAAASAAASAAADPSGRRAFRSLRIEQPQPHVAELVLCGPGRGNAMGRAFWRELPQAVARLAADPQVRAFVVRGDGAHFSYGLDLVDMAPLFAADDAGVATRHARVVEAGRAMQAAFDAIAACGKPSVAAVSGWCIGGGVELICACDLRVCAQDARFALREVKVGMVADLGGIQRLPLIVGEGIAREMALTGDALDAARAQAAGLVNAVHADAQATVDAARALAARIAANPPMVVAGIKDVMNARIDAGIRAGLAQAVAANGALIQSEDFAEALAAFRDKREPVFSGK